MGRSESPDAVTQKVRDRNHTRYLGKTIQNKLIDSISSTIWGAIVDGAGLMLVLV